MTYTMSATAGSAMCHGNYSVWCWFVREEDEKSIHLSGYLRKGDLWEDAKANGATPAQMKEMKAMMAKAPKKNKYCRR